MVKYEWAARSTIIVTIGSIGGVLLSYIISAAIAYFYGASRILDAYYMAQSIPIIFSGLLMMSVIHPVLIPIFSQKFSENEEEAEKAISNLMNVSLVFLMIIVILGVIFMPFLVSKIAPGFDDDSRKLTVKLTRILFPTLIFSILGTIVSATFHSQKRFSPPALIPLLAPLVTISFFFLLRNKLGIVSLTVGTLVASTCNFCLLLYFLLKNWTGYKFWINLKHPVVKKAVAMFAPCLIGIMFGQATLVVNQRLASWLAEGSLTVLRLSSTVINFAKTFFIGSIPLVMFPTLTQDIISKDKDRLRHTAVTGMKMFSFIVIPMTVGMIVLRIPIIKVLFEHGAFTAEDTHRAASALICYALGLFSYGANSIFGNIFWAAQEVKLLVKMGIVLESITIILSIILVKFMDYLGLALAVSIGAIFYSVMYLVLLKKKFYGLHKIFVDTYYLKIVFLSIVMGFICWISLNRLSSVLNFSHTYGSLVSLFIVILIGILSYVSLAFLLRVEEVSIIWKIGKNILRVNR